jgi:hypothetical protein
MSSSIMKKTSTIPVGGRSLKRGISLNFLNSDNRQFDSSSATLNSSSSDEDISTSEVYNSNEKDKVDVITLFPADISDKNLVRPAVYGEFSSSSSSSSASSSIPDLRKNDTNNLLVKRDNLELVMKQKKQKWLYYETQLMLAAQARFGENAHMKVSNVLVNRTNVNVKDRLRNLKRTYGDNIVTIRKKFNVTEAFVQAELGLDNSDGDHSINSNTKKTKKKKTTKNALKRKSRDDWSKEDITYLVKSKEANLTNVTIAKKLSMKVGGVTRTNVQVGEKFKRMKGKFCNDEFLLFENYRLEAVV